MAIDPRQEILRMMMAQTQRGGGGGQMMPPGVMPPGAIPPSAMPAVGGYGRGGGHVGPESREATTPSDRDPEFDPDEYQGMSDPGMQGGLPPEVMKLASMGIRPGDLQQSNAMPRRPVDRAGGPDDVDPMESYGKPGDAEDPRFGPQDDSVRDTTEGEIDEARSEMMRGTGTDEDPDEPYEWEGDRTPTPADLEYVREHPTDGNLSSFFQAFPTWTAEDILMRGGNPSKSPDEYAMDDDQFAELQSDRSTRIDER